MSSFFKTLEDKIAENIKISNANDLKLTKEQVTDHIGVSYMNSAMFGTTALLGMQHGQVSWLLTPLFGLNAILSYRRAGKLEKNLANGKYSKDNLQINLKHNRQFYIIYAGGGALFGATDIGLYSLMNYFSTRFNEPIPPGIVIGTAVIGLFSIAYFAKALKFYGKYKQHKTILSAQS